MDISPPEKQDLLDAASKNYLDLTEEELEGFSILLQGIFSQLEALDQLSSAIPAPVTGPRDFGQRPGPGEDPYNAILRRCMVKGSGSGKLSRSQGWPEGQHLGIRYAYDLRFPFSFGLYSRHRCDDSTANSRRGWKHRCHAEHGRLRLVGQR